MLLAFKLFLLIFDLLKLVRLHSLSINLLINLKILLNYYNIKHNVLHKNHFESFILYWFFCDHKYLNMKMVIQKY